MTAPTIGYAGITHLGLVSAAAAAEKGFKVVCFDTETERLEPVRRGELPVVEPELPELLAKNQGRIQFTNSSEDLALCDVVYMALDVSTDERGVSDLGPIHHLLGRVDEGMDKSAVLVVLSQVPPGFTRRLSRPESCRFYQVETLIFGRAIERALNPERFIVGCADPRRPLPSPLATFLDSFACPVLPMGFESAELAKISINMCLVASITTANTLAELCERLGANWAEIAPALKLDRRIGKYAYLDPGLGIAGGNLERDLATLVRLGDQEGTDVGVVRACKANSRYRRFWALRMLHETVLGDNHDPLIAVLGLAYKQDTASTKNSPALALIENLRAFRLKVFDPVVTAEREWHPKLSQAESALAAAEGADALLVMTPWADFAALDAADIADALAGTTVIDPYGILDGAACGAAGLTYRTLGAGGD